LKDPGLFAYSSKPKKYHLNYSCPDIIKKVGKDVTALLVSALISGGNYEN